MAIATVFVPETKFLLEKYINTSGLTKGVVSDLTLLLVLISITISINPFVVHKRERHFHAVFVVSTVALLCNYIDPIVGFISKNTIGIMVTIVIFSIMKLFSEFSDYFFGFSDERDTSGFLLESVLDSINIFSDD